MIIPNISSDEAYSFSSARLYHYSREFGNVTQRIEASHRGIVNSQNNSGVRNAVEVANRLLDGTTVNPDPGSMHGELHAAEQSLQEAFEAPGHEGSVRYPSLQLPQRGQYRTLPGPSPNIAIATSAA